MLKAALVGALALTMVESFSITQHGIGITPAAADEIVVTEGQIGRLHAALHLTAAQERHWYPVAAILRALGRHQAQYQVASNDESFVARARARVAGYTVTTVTMERLRSAAQPLIATLSDEQKSAGHTVLASMGVSF
jgi:hypothetical protein